MARETIYFWLIFLVINFLFFIPNYLTTLKKSQFFPFLSKEKVHFSTKMAIRHLLIRPNQDFFRLNLDLLLLTLFLFLTRSFIPFWAVLSIFFLVILFGIVNQIYIAILLNIFKSNPSIKSDLSFLDAGLLIVSRSNVFQVLAAIIAVMLFLGLTGGLAYYLASQLVFLPFSIANIILPSILIIPGLYKLKDYDYSLLHYRAIFSPINHFFRNIAYSNEILKYRDLSESFYKSQNKFDNLSLKEKPNVIILAIESYGSLLYKDPKFKEAYENFIQEIEQKLDEKDWKVCSILSKPPVFAGGSWLSYTSFLYGFLFNRMDLFNVLFHKTSNFKYYKSILDYFRSLGYKNYFLSGLGGYENSSVDFDYLGRIYSTDRFMKYQDYDYKGKTVSYAGFGLSIPDQYTLNAGYQKIKEETKGEPFTAFFPTLNSHWKWDSPTHIASDWKALNSPSFPFDTSMDANASINERYIASIKYQMEMVVDFVTKELDENTIVVLFGDHQPPFITDEAYDKETPIHIISKNTPFLTSFENYNFIDSMNLSSEVQGVEHQGFKSLFLREFFTAYGDPNNNKHPDFLPNGLQLLSHNKE